MAILRSELSDAVNLLSSRCSSIFYCPTFTALLTRYPGRIGSHTKKTHPQVCLYVNQQLPILPGRLQPSTFGVYELNYCVRDGNRWILIAIATESIRVCTLKTT